MRIQHALGADVMFAFDELTSLRDPYDYQVESLARTEAWAKRCVDELIKTAFGASFAAVPGAVRGGAGG